MFIYVGISTVSLVIYVIDVEYVTEDGVTLLGDRGEGGFHQS